MLLILSGSIAGLLIGYVLQRGDICFHSTFRGIFEHRWSLFKTWALGVALAAVGLSIVFAIGPWDGLNRGLAFRPVANIAGGAAMGVGMVVAASCNSGLFYKLGAGMLGSFVGLLGLGAGELVAAQIPFPGPTVLGHGSNATIPGVLGLPQPAVALSLGAVVVLLLFRSGGRQGREWRWGWPVAGVALGVATVAAWVLAGIGGHSFGPSTVGAFESVAGGNPLWWLIAFLAALVAGSAIGAITTGAGWIRGERPGRYVQLLIGGFLLGGGAKIAGGCNLGHGLSGAAQLNVSSLVVVASIVTGVGVARSVQIRWFGVGPQSKRAHWKQTTRQSQKS